MDPEPKEKLCISTLLAQSDTVTAQTGVGDTRHHSAQRVLVAAFQLRM